MDLRRELGVALAALELAACFGPIGCDPVEDDTLDEPPPTYADVQERVFEASCAFAACHTGAAPAGDMSLKGDPYDQLVDAPSMQRPELLRVHPGDPDASYLVMKLEGRGMLEAMPPTAPLDDARIDLVRDWITAGAPRQ